ncbi:uncharacterized protein IL334_006754 [Kwoniella shivajii]|uniref:Uncharacterized protein n=1 Tax=Kwoniella shivajii TaxID=564305 RepID=A0ABZ1D7H6_9TREE|nr:hypothetical protein IL334_006754 [Kwoniella shivajii]
MSDTALSRHITQATIGNPSSENDFNSELLQDPYHVLVPSALTYITQTQRDIEAYGENNPHFPAGQSSTALSGNPSTIKIAFRGDENNGTRNAGYIESLSELSPCFEKSYRKRLTRKDFESAIVQARSQGGTPPKNMTEAILKPRVYMDISAPVTSLFDTVNDDGSTRKVDAYSARQFQFRHLIKEDSCTKLIGDDIFSKIESLDIQVRPRQWNGLSVGTEYERQSVDSQSGISKPGGITLKQSSNDPTDFYFTGELSKEYGCNIICTFDSKSTEFKSDLNIAQRLAARLKLKSALKNIHEVDTDRNIGLKLRYDSQTESK